MPAKTNPLGDQVISEQVLAERRGLGVRHIAAVFLAVAMLATGAFSVSGCSPKDPEVNTPTATEAPANPSETQEIPAGAKDFIDEYGSRYDDPVSTYYAESAYRQESRQASILSDEYISEYDFDIPAKDQGILGFETYSLPLDAKIDRRVSMDLFNNYTSDQLTIYMNALARNPNEKEIVNRQFMGFCSFIGEVSPSMLAKGLTGYDGRIIAMMETFDSVVERYGSNANYIVNKASEPANGGTNTLFHDGDTVIGTLDDGVTRQFQSSTDIAISVEIYNSNSQTIKHEVINDVELIVTRNPYNTAFSASGISIGQVKKQ